FSSLWLVVVFAVLFSPTLSPVRLVLGRPLQLVVVSRALSGPARSFLSFGGRCLGGPLLSHALSGPARSFPSCGGGGLGGPLLSCALSGPARSRSSTSACSRLPGCFWSGSVFPLFWRSLSWRTTFLPLSLRSGWVFVVHFC